MKNKMLCCLLFFVASVACFAENSGVYSVVNIGRGKELEMRKDPTITAPVTERIPAGESGIATTWKTAKTDKEYWIEIRYNGTDGWVQRNYLTNKTLDMGSVTQAKLDDLLYRFAKAFQKGTFQDIAELIYPLRGLGLYTDPVGRVTFYQKKELEKDWYYVVDRRYTGGTTINYYTEALNAFLEMPFEIDAALAAGNPELPEEIRNFTAVKATYKNKTLLVGLEQWNGMLYVAYLALVGK